MPTGYEAVSGETILPSQHNPPLEDLAAAMTASLPRNGAAPMTGNLAMGSNKITGLAAGANPADAVRFDQIATRDIAVDRYFAKADRNTAAWTKTGSGTAETSQQIWVGVNGVIRSIASGTTITMPTLTAGTDYAIWANPDGTLQADASFSTPPVANARQVGGFHYAPGGNAAAYNSGGDTTPQINEHSFWDLKFRPACEDPRGMTLVAGQFWVDIYLLGVDHHINGTSRYNVRIADDGNPPKVPDMFGGDGSATYSNANWWTMNEVLAAYGKQSLDYQEFAAAAYGVIEKTSGGTDPVDTILRANWTSVWGLMLATGNMWFWGRDFGRGGNSDAWSNDADGRGDTYALSQVARFGAPWSGGSNAGSRASGWNNVPSNSNSSIGARGRSDHLITE